MLSVARKLRWLPRTGAPAKRVGPYRLCVELASGGMATVYLGCTDAVAAGARFAAVKVVHSHLAADAAFTEMFVDEAEIASRIRHANVCAVQRFDVSGGLPYIAMEYLVGEPLSAIWRKVVRRQDKITVARDARHAAKILADACEGLHAAHELTDYDGEPLEVVHRDVSPGNVIVTFDGVAKVVDFGVAAASRKRHHTETGMVKGKFAYIAPECLRGRKADRRSDVWAIGVLAWELATGRRLFRGRSDVDTLRAVMDAEIPKPSSVRAGLPAEFDDVVMRALQRDPAARYPTARALGRELARVANTAEVVTSADIAEWLEQLFPGGKERKQQLLELALQIAEDDARSIAPASELRASTLTEGMPVVDGDAIDSEATAFFDPSRRSLPLPTGSGSEPVEGVASRRRGRWTLTVGILVGLGLGCLVTVLALAQGGGFPSGLAAALIGASRSEPALPTAPPLAAPPPPPRSELRLRPGSALARGPYLLEIVESSPDELVLQIRLADGSELVEEESDR